MDIQEIYTYFAEAVEDAQALARKYNRHIPGPTTMRTNDEEAIRQAKLSWLAKLESFNPADTTWKDGIFDPWASVSRSVKVQYNKYNSSGRIVPYTFPYAEIGNVIQLLKNSLGNADASGNTDHVDDAKAVADAAMLQSKEANGKYFSAALDSAFRTNSKATYDAFLEDDSFNHFPEELSRLGLGLAGGGNSRDVREMMKSIGANGSPEYSREAALEFISDVETMAKVYDHFVNGGPTVSQSDIDRVRNFKLSGQRMLYGDKSSTIIGQEAFKFDNGADYGACMGKKEVIVDGKKKPSGLYRMLSDLSDIEGHDGAPIVNMRMEREASTHQGFVGIFGEVAEELSTLASEDAYELDDEGNKTLTKESKKTVRKAVKKVYEKIEGATEFYQNQDDISTASMIPDLCSEIDELVESCMEDIGITNPDDKQVAVYCVAVGSKIGRNIAQSMGGKFTHDNRQSGVDDDGQVRRHDIKVETTPERANKFFEKATEASKKRFGEKLSDACFKHLASDTDTEIRVSQKLSFSKEPNVVTGGVSLHRMLSNDPGIVAAEDEFFDNHMRVAEEMGNIDAVAKELQAGRDLRRRLTTEVQDIKQAINSGGIPALLSIMKDKKAGLKLDDYDGQHAYRSMIKGLEAVKGTKDTNKQISAERMFIADYLGYRESSLANKKAPGIASYLALKHHLSSGSNKRLVIATSTPNGDTSYNVQSTSFGPLYHLAMAGSPDVEIAVYGRPGSIARSIGIEHKGEKTMRVTTRTKKNKDTGVIGYSIQSSSSKGYLDSTGSMITEVVQSYLFSLEEFARFLGAKEQQIRLLKEIAPQTT